MLTKSLEIHEQQTADLHHPLDLNCPFSSLRKQPTFGDSTTGFPTKWCLRNERRNSALMTRHYPDLGSNVSSVWNFCTRFSDGILQGNHWWCRQMSAVFSDYPFRNKKGTGSSLLAQGLLRLLLGTGKNWPIADQRIPNNDPINNCGTHFGSSALLISKVVNGVKHVLNIKLKSLCLKFQEKINTTPAPLADNVLEILTGEGLKKTI